MKIWGIIDIEIETDEPITPHQLEKLKRRINKIVETEFEELILGAVDYCEISTQSHHPISLGSLGCDFENENDN